MYNLITNFYIYKGCDLPINIKSPPYVGIKREV